jgi:hypothetical protein
MTRYYCDFCNKEVGPISYPNNTITVKFDVYERRYLCCEQCFEELTDLLHNDRYETFNVETNNKEKLVSKSFFKSIKEKLCPKSESKITSSKQ